MELDDKPLGGYHFSFPDKIIQEQQQRRLLQGLHVCRAGYFPRFKGHITKRPFGFPGSHILIYCTAGQGWFESVGQRWTIMRGQLLFVLKDVAHSYGADEAEPWTIHWAHFAGEETAVFLNLLDITPQNPIITIGEQLNIVRLFYDIYDQCQLGYSFYILLSGSALLRQILSNITLQHRFIATSEKGLDVERTIQFMLDSLATSKTVQAFAVHANLSPSHFSRLFHKKTGYAPLDYFIRLKMQKACELLAGTDLLVREISLALGYHDPYYFSRLFKKMIGQSPRAYRRNQQVII